MKSFYILILAQESRKHETRQFHDTCRMCAYTLNYEIDHCISMTLFYYVASYVVYPLSSVNRA